MTAPVLETENLVKIYGRGHTRFDALKGINMEIRDGESLAVVGKSGSGKSTLMHLLALLDEPTHGVVALKGKPTGNLGAKQLNELRNSTFGFVFQQFFLTANQTVLDNVTLPLKIAGTPAAERKKRGYQVLEQLEMADKATNRAADLSGGQKQRAVIARALVNNPSVIFADEPTGNLDSATSKVVEDILFDLNRDKGITLVVVTHDTELASRCSRQIYLVDGTIDQSVRPPQDSPQATQRPPSHSRTETTTSEPAASEVPWAHQGATTSRDARDPHGDAAPKYMPTTSRQQGDSE